MGKEIATLQRYLLDACAGLRCGTEVLAFNFAQIGNQKPRHRPDRHNAWLHPNVTVW
jgi:hypothetical protein